MAEVVLGLDVGDARIGLAVGEVGRTLAFGRGHLERRGEAHDVEAVAELARSEGASRVVVGLPLRTDGSDSQQTRRARSFAAALERAGLSVSLEDERFTTRIAQQRLLDAPLGRRDRQEKGRLDEASAVLILEGWLTREASGRA